MPVDVTTSAEIARPVEAVATYAMDPRTAPEWYANIDRVEVLTEGPPRVGSRARFVARFLGRTLAYTYVFTEVEPGRRLTMTTDEGPFPMTTTYTFEAVGPDRTRMTLRNHGEPSGFGAVAAPLMAAAMRRANRADLASITRILEEKGE